MQHLIPPIPRQAVRMALLGAALLSARGSTIDSNSFTFVSTDPKHPMANDFHLRINPNEKLVQDPQSGTFPNSSGKGTSSGDFSGENLANNASTNVTFQSDGNSPKPRGYFTWHDQDAPGKQISGETRSKALDGLFVSFIPSGGGGSLLASLDLYNDFGSTLTGQVNIYINSGGFNHFNPAEYATLRSSTLLYSSSYTVNDGVLAAHVQALVPSADYYFLVTGTANSGDGTGSFPFAIGMTATPEPGSLTLCGAGALAAAAQRWMRRRRKKERAGNLALDPTSPLP